MVTKDKLKSYANKLMFDMNEEEYQTLLSEFDVMLKQMDLIGNIENIDSVEPMTFPFELENVEYRNDNDSRNIEIEELMNNTTHNKGREVKVPKVVE